MKKLLSLLLAGLLALSVTIPALAAPAGEAEQAAWTLYHYGLFQGLSTDARGFPVFGLDQVPTRAQGVTMLVRLLGKEETAWNGSWTTPFTDVPDWAAPYIGYAYDQGLTVGVSADRFAPNAPIRATEYLTLVLRALGYSSGEDFAWDQAWNLTDELGVTDGSYGPKTTAFDRGDVAWISLRALDAKDKKTKRTLRTTLKLKSDVDQCVWEETWQSCLKDQMVFSFAPAEGSPRTYTKFTVDSAWANGQPCQIKQFSTKRDVTSQLKKYPKDTRDAVGSETFALVYLSYDEAAVLAAATETVEDNGHTYPVIKFQMNVTGTLAGSPAVKEKAEMAYYILGYWGEEYAKS